jgi:hypothetical protein
VDQRRRLNQKFDVAIAHIQAARCDGMDSRMMRRETTIERRG